MHASPAEFAAEIKKNVLAQLTKWEIDRAALQAKAESAGDKAADAAKVLVDLLCCNTAGSAVFAVAVPPRVLRATKYLCPNGNRERAMFFVLRLVVDVVRDTHENLPGLGRISDRTNVRWCMCLQD